MNRKQISFGAFLLVALLVLTGAGCGGKKSSSDKSSSASSSKPGDLLKHGLDAQVRGNVTQAAKDYSAVIAKDPKNKFAYYNLGLIAQQAGDTSTADKNYSQTLTIDPDYPPALFNLAIVRTDTAPQDALDLYRHVIAVKPNDGSAHLNLGFLLRSQGQAAAGDTEIQRAIELDPKLAQRTVAPQGPGSTGASGAPAIATPPTSG